MAKTAKPRIFVNIASYRDRECQWTVKDLFEKAGHPDRISAGICWQFDQEQDQDCFQVATRPEQVRVLPFNWRESEGVCWARHQAQQLWDGEDYTLQIDSHMRFVPGWDELVIEELKACEADKPLLSCNPASYIPPDRLQKELWPTVRRVLPFAPDGNIRGRGETLDRSPEKPLKGAFIAGGFVFSASEMLSEVPHDPYLYFDQEEITTAIRLYTHGWDVFSSRRQFLYHFYNTDKNSVRPLHWRDLREADEGRLAFLRDRGLKRFNHLTGYQLSNQPEILKDIGRYGLGNTRPLQQFETYTGVDFKRKVASEKALRAQFIEGLERYRKAPVYVPELDDPHAQKSSIRLVSSTPQAMLEPGDFIPFFEAEDTNRKVRGVELRGGRHCMLFFLPAGDEAYLDAFFDRLQREVPQDRDVGVWQLFILDGPIDRLIAYKEKKKLNHLLLADPSSAIARSFGLEKGVHAGYVLSPNLRIVTRHAGLEAPALAAAVANDCRIRLTEYYDKYRQPKVVSEGAPVLIVPDVLPRELCQTCIHAFRGGETFEGTVGSDIHYRPAAKVRTDFIVDGKLLETIDEKLSRSLFPEIEKVFGFEVTNREIYKIGLYSGERGGFFKQHRDNFEPPLYYRRVAMTLHLNDEYEGGGLRFPEYDENIYRASAGSAVVFSCATLHEARPVTKGERIIMVGFFHGEEDEAFRRHQLAAAGYDINVKNYTPIARRQYPELVVSRQSVKDWRAHNVQFNPSTATPSHKGEPAMTQKDTPSIHIAKGGKAEPRKTFESKQAIVYDDFLPEEIYQRVYKYATEVDYEYVNTKSVMRAWHVHDGFPLRSTMNLFRYADEKEKPKADYVYPTNTGFDVFFDQLYAVQPDIQHLIGKPGQEGWMNVSLTAWIYPHGTGLSMHDDGSGVYTGAYVYFLNPIWRPHWGGMLIMMDEDSNRLVHEYRNAHDQMEFYRQHWLHHNGLDEMLMEHGFGKCILPRRNRAVFIANDAYHMVTRVNEAAGDNLRMSLAGFYHRRHPVSHGNY